MLENNITGLQHLGIPVTNLERSLDFYTRLGFTTVMQKEFLDEIGPVKVAMLRIGDFTLELYQQPGETGREVAGREDGHVDHFALNVGDIHQAHLDIRKAGLNILEADAPKFLPFWEHGVKFFTVRGPDGEKVEFNQFLTAR
ncbi:MAG: VOC family protein [Anaerolineae bacterium]|nr:VOC family protein [Anaerolineae bacterium]